MVAFIFNLFKKMLLFHCSFKGQFIFLQVIDTVKCQVLYIKSKFAGNKFVPSWSQVLWEIEKEKLYYKFYISLVSFISTLYNFSILKSEQDVFIKRGIYRTVIVEAKWEQSNDWQIFANYCHDDVVILPRMLITNLNMW